MILVLNTQETIRILACGIYCGSLVALYAASTLSHMFYDLAWRRFFRTLDQACIYLLIAGSFTPLAVVYLWDNGWPILLAAMWILAIFGVFLVLWMQNLTPAAKVTYGFLGWLPIISLKTLFAAAPFEIFVWILAGGLFYSVGSVFLRFPRHARFFHALWHTFVIAGSVCHYVAILLAVT
jgi:hemolysin III